MKATALVASLVVLTACGGKPAQAERPQVAFVTNGAVKFWALAAAGAEAAAKEFDVDCQVRMPDGVLEQKRTVEDLLTQNVDGIAISPIDGSNQIDMIDEACAQTHVVTHDSDAPKSQRKCFIGVDNYAAGQMCGELIKEAFPEGGSVMLFIGRLEQDNGRKRRQGILDTLLGRTPDSERYDEPGAPLEGGGFTVVDTRTDQFDAARAKANAEDAIAVHPDLDCMVGLFAYNTPACLEAVRNAEKLGEITLIGFDEDDATIQGLLDGHIYGTVVQDPYRYGYESVRILGALSREKPDAIPAGAVLDIPARTIRQADAAAFKAKLEELVGGR